MKIPILKRIKISSYQELSTWLVKNSERTDSVMLVTYGNTSNPKHVPRDRMSDALFAHDWVEGPRFTLNADLIGHVIVRK